MQVQGASVGGGNILVTGVNGMAVSFTGQYNTILVLHQDKPGAIAAVTQFVASTTETFPSLLPLGAPKPYLPFSRATAS